MNTAGNDILVSYKFYEIKHLKIYFLFRLLIDDVSTIFVIGLLPFLTLTVLEISSLLLFLVSIRPSQSVSSTYESKQNFLQSSCSIHGAVVAVFFKGLTSCITGLYTFRLDRSLNGVPRG